MFKDREGREWKLFPHLEGVETFERETGVRVLGAFTAAHIDPTFTFDNIFGMTGNLYQYLLYVSFTETERKEQKLTAAKVRGMIPVRDITKLTAQAFAELVAEFTDTDVEDDELPPESEEDEEDPNGTSPGHGDTSGK